MSAKIIPFSHPVQYKAGVVAVDVELLTDILNRAVSNQAYARELSAELSSPENKHLIEHLWNMVRNV